jgi:chromosome segregation ATPase
MKLQIEKIKSESKESQLIKIRDRIIEDQKTDNLSVKNELQRVNALYIKYKSSVDIYKTKIYDLKSTLDVYYSKIKDLMSQNKQLEVQLRSLKSLNPPENDALNLVLSKNSSFIDSLKHSLKVSHSKTVLEP